MTTLNRLKIVSDSVQTRDIAEVWSFLERRQARPVLVCAWIIDEQTGRPVCRWIADAHQ
jgi:hypothetical protein